VLSTLAPSRCAEPTAFLAEMQRVLLPGGELYLLEPQRSSTETTVIAALQQAGFRESHQLLRGVENGDPELDCLVIHARANE